MHLNEISRAVGETFISHVWWLFLCIASRDHFTHPDIKGPWGKEWLQKGYNIHSLSLHSSYLLPLLKHWGGVQELVKYLNHWREREQGGERDLELLRKQINLCIVVINPVSNRKAPASSGEAKRRFFHRGFASQCGRSHCTVRTHTHTHTEYPSD